MDLAAFLQNPPVALVVAGVAIAIVLVIIALVGQAPAQVVQLRKAHRMLVDVIREKGCHPIMVRLAWHDSGTYDMKHKAMPWPAAGGAIGSIRYNKEITAGPNAGLDKALALLDPIHQACPLVSMADLIQMASATAIELSGGPKIDMIYGRLDASDSPEQSTPPFGLPDAFPPDPAAHLRWVFGKYDGMGDREIVALSGAHTLGRAFKDRSGASENGPGDAGATKYTASAFNPTRKGSPCVFMPGGKSWTPKWLSFDNSYFQLLGKQDPDLLALPTDQILETDPGFAPFFTKYRDSQDAFFADYAAAHKKLSELGAKFEPPVGYRI